MWKYSFRSQSHAFARMCCQLYFQENLESQEGVVLHSEDVFPALKILCWITTHHIWGRSLRLLIYFIKQKKKHRFFFSANTKMLQHIMADSVEPLRPLRLQQNRTKRPPPVLPHSLTWVLQLHWIPHPPQYSLRCRPLWPHLLLPWHCRQFDRNASFSCVLTYLPAG